MKTLIKSGRIITAVDDYNADIFIDGETVTTIGKRLDMEADVVLDASGKLVIPGGIDPHTHMELPFGGTTTIIVRSDAVSTVRRGEGSYRLSRSCHRHSSLRSR